MGLSSSLRFWGDKRSGGRDSLREHLVKNGKGGEVKSLCGDKKTVTPYSSATILGRISYSWMTPLVSLGYKRPLNLEDIPQLSGLDSIRNIFPVFAKKLKELSPGRNSVTTCNLVKALVFTVWKDILLSAIYLLIHKLPSYVEAYLINDLVQFLNGSGESKKEGYFLVIAFTIAKLFESLGKTQYYFKVQQGGSRLRAAMVAMIYSKCMRLSCQSKQRHTCGEMINFMSVDAERIIGFGWYLHDPWIVLVQVVLAFVILYKNLGLASVVPLLSTVVVMLANIPLGTLLERYQKKLMASKDDRMKATSEVLRNMRVLKLQAWEMKFLSKINSLRDTEVRWLRRYEYVSALSVFVHWVIPTFVSVATFGAAVLMGTQLEPGKVLSSLATFALLKEPIYRIPDAISKTVQVKVSLDRIASFLSLEDMEHDIVEKHQKSCSSDVAIDIVDGSFTWDESSPTPLLKGINLRVRHGMKVAICGPVSSGKSRVYTWASGIKSCCLCYSSSGVLTCRGFDLGGKISKEGDYTSILKSETEFMELVGAHKEALSSIDSFEERVLTVKNDNSTTMQNEESGKDDCSSARLKGQLIQDEERKKGGVGFSVYWTYMTLAFGGILVPFICLGQVLFQALQVGGNYWMTWATPRVGSSTTLLSVYAVFAIAGSFCILARTLLLVTAGFNTATMLFHKMHLCIFRAPMSFFDATPSGRILNRASTDQSVVDLDIPFQLGAFLNAIVELLGVIVVMSLVTWQVFAIFIPVIAICIYFQQHYLPSSRELARLAGVSKAPVIQHFAETISGLTTIRAFGQEPDFFNTIMKLVDDHSRPKFHGFAFAVLAVTYGLNLNSQLVFVAVYFYMTENLMVSVERMTQYTSVSSESPLVSESCRPDMNWPPNGEIDIRNLKVRYAPQLPLVLRGITCTLLGGKKTGVVGRTGSGKSTLIQTLFRIVEPVEGEIFIDGINVSSIGLHDLRAKLSIIPQDPTMFAGSIRANLDPLEEYTDGQIWEALDKCQLGDEVRKKEAGLDSPVAENGENWSVGQRQLVCLGRVLLKKSKILVLDEATASVDTATDNLIQQTVRQNFSSSTVITIAHRMTSVLASDMVLLLNNGLFHFLLIFINS
ncbi:unnamed protein product [Cuscuta campestris]|uniref:ABC-type xenobiotic transporter n=1 Tax=Cuscuta campestris TaxID=132261 RepID=A0A484L9S4_9ASTE|nr:unnamed protein product [Cuscuta campestris]